MLNKKQLSIILGIILIISALSLVYAREYSIDEAFINLTVESNGLLHVDEQYDYSFIGTYNGVYRDIPLKSGESVENLKISAIGAYPQYIKTIENGQYRLKIYLYKDAAHTQKISDTNVKIFISYDMSNVVTVYNDTASLQYKIWGENWDVKVGKVQTTVNLPSSTGNSYWLNPSQYNISSSITGNTIHSLSTAIPSGKYYELQVLMPTEDFTNGIYAKHNDINAKDRIIQIQEDYKNGETFYNNLFLTLGIIFAISPLILVGIYYKYGREPKTGYEGIYEREIPTEDPPSKINALIERKAQQNPDMKGYEASIMDLINRKIIKLETEQNNEIKTITLDLSRSNEKNLDSSEQILIETLKSFSHNGKLNLEELNNQLYNEQNAKYFRAQYNTWGEECKRLYLNDTIYKEYFNNKGEKLSKIYGILAIILGGTLAVISFASTLPMWIVGFIGSIILLISGIITFLLPKDIFGQWSMKGREFYQKWTNFKNFLKDNSLLNEHPPESIVIWNKYLVYATALGVADNVYKSMKIHIPNTEYYDNDLYIFHSYNGAYMMHHAFKTGISTATASESNSGLGGIGGGSGGGGGGAF